MDGGNPDDSSALPDLTSGKPDPQARRLRLREFQSRLAARIHAAHGDGEVQAGQLGVVIAGSHYLFDLTQAGEIAAVGALMKVPLTQPWFLGLANIRGKLISVFDVAQFNGTAATVLDKQCRIISLAPQLGLHDGFLVSQVLGLRHVADMQPHDMPGTGTPGTGTGCHPVPALQGPHYIDQKQVVWQLLDLMVLRQSPQFLHVERDVFPAPDDAECGP